MKVKEFKKGLEDDTLNIDWGVMKHYHNPKAVLLESIKYEGDMLMDWDDIVQIRIGDPITGGTLRPAYDKGKNVIWFGEEDWSAKTIGFRPGVKPVELDEGYDKPFGGTIPLPSGKLVINNHFDADFSLEPPDDKRYSYYNINGMRGQMRTCKWFLEQGIAYGQMGNMDMTVFSNGKSVIIGNSVEGVRSFIDYCRYSKEDKSQLPKLRSKRDEYWKILKSGKFKEVETISLRVWRYEAVDSDKLAEFHGAPVDEEENCIVPLEGTSLRFEHYYRTLADAPNPNIYAQFWVE